MTVDRDLLQAVLVALTSGQGNATEEEWAKAYQEVHANLVAGTLVDLLCAGKIGLRFGADGELYYTRLEGVDFDFGDESLAPAVEALIASPPPTDGA